MNCNEVIRGLWQGGMVEDAQAVASSFDVLVLCAVELQPDQDTLRTLLPNTLVIRCPLMDREDVSDRQLAAAASTGRAVIRRVVERQRVLVTCAAGWNRSGLVTALGLVAGGFLPDAAVKLVRRARGPNALSNQRFERFVYEYGQRRRARR